MDAKLQPDLYLRQYRHTRSHRFVVKPNNTTHVVVIENFSNGQCYVDICDLKNGGWFSRKIPELQVGHPSLPLAMVLAAALHRKETQLQRGVVHGAGCGCDSCVTVRGSHSVG